MTRSRTERQRLCCWAAGYDLLPAEYKWRADYFGVSLNSPVNLPVPPSWREKRVICWDVTPPTLAPSAQSRTGTPVCDPTGEQTLAPQHSPDLPPAPFLLLGLPVLVFFWLSEALAGLVVFLPTNKTCSTCCCCPNVWDPLREKMLVTGSAWVVCSEG